MSKELEDVDRPDPGTPIGEATLRQLVTEIGARTYAGSISYALAAPDASPDSVAITEQWGDPAEVWICCTMCTLRAMRKSTDPKALLDQFFPALYKLSGLEAP